MFCFFCSVCSTWMVAIITRYLLFKVSRDLLDDTLGQSRIVHVQLCRDWDRGWCRVHDSHTSVIHLVLRRHLKDKELKSHNIPANATLSWLRSTETMRHKQVEDVSWYSCCCWTAGRSTQTGRPCCWATPGWPPCVSEPAPAGRRTADGRPSTARSSPPSLTGNAARRGTPVESKTKQRICVLYKAETFVRRRHRNHLMDLECFNTKTHLITRLVESSTEVFVLGVVQKWKILHQIQCWMWFFFSFFLWLIILHTVLQSDGNALIPLLVFWR